MGRSVSMIETLERRMLLAAVPVVTGDGSTIANGDATPAQRDLTDFSWMYPGGSLTRQFVVRNAGDSDLLITSASLGGAGASAFKIVSAPTAPIAAGQRAPITVSFTPAGLMRSDAVVQMQTNSATAPTYSFAVSGAGIRTVASRGLRYGVISAGSGVPARNGWMLDVLYTGWVRSSGVVFDASIYHDNKPYSFVLGQKHVIAGWDRGILGMRPGERRVLFVPSALAYGEAGRGADIPPGSDLIFETQLQPYTPVTLSGNGQPIVSGDNTPRAADNTAFYSTGDMVTQEIVIDFRSAALRDSAWPLTLGGSGRDRFAIGQSRKVGDEGYRYAIPITYWPQAAGASKATLTLVTKSPLSPTYRIVLLGQPLPEGTSFSGRTLSVAGSAGNDVIGLSQTTRSYVLKVGKRRATFDLTDADSILLSGGAGDDRITVSRSVRSGVQIDGGDGRDHLTGGSGDDTLTGGDGADVLAGRAGANVYHVADGVADLLNTTGSLASTGTWDDALDIIRPNPLLPSP